MTNYRKTASDLIKELSTDPEYLARESAQDDLRKKLLDQQARESAPVLAALRSAGVEVQSIWDLSDGGKSYPEAIPILLNKLRNNYPDHVREGILRALGTPHASSHWDELVKIFEHNAANLSPGIRYVAALALSGAASDAVLDDVIRLINKKELGLDRAPLLLSLINSKSSKAKMTLLELRTDPDIGKEIKKMRRLARHQNS